MKTKQLTPVILSLVLSFFLLQSCTKEEFNNYDIDQKTDFSNQQKGLYIYKKKGNGIVKLPVPLKTISRKKKGNGVRTL